VAAVRAGVAAADVGGGRKQSRMQFDSQDFFHSDTNVAIPTM